MNFPEGSLDIVEFVMALEAAFPDLGPEECERLGLELKERFERGDFDSDDLDDDDLAALVQKLGPRTPRGQTGAAATPVQTRDD